MVLLCRDYVVMKLEWGRIGVGLVSDWGRIGGIMVSDWDRIGVITGVFGLITGSEWDDNGVGMGF